MRSTQQRSCLSSTQGSLLCRLHTGTCKVHSTRHDWLQRTVVWTGSLCTSTSASWSRKRSDKATREGGTRATPSSTEAEPVVDESTDPYAKWCKAWEFAYQKGQEGLGYRAAARATRDEYGRRGMNTRRGRRGMTVPQLQAVLAFKDVTFPKTAKKPVLLTLATDTVKLPTAENPPQLALPPPPASAGLSAPPDPSVATASASTVEEGESSEGSESDMDEEN